LSASEISPVNCARTSQFPFRRLSWHQSKKPLKKFWRNIRDRSSSKNPLCAPTSPIHTILCETVEDTRAWLRHVNYAEGVFLQEYLGRAEIGHIVLVSGGEIYSLVTNQEYKYAFNGNQGVVAGAPLGGLVERDPGDKYGLAKKLIHPLLPWLRAAKFNGPLQVTAVKSKDRWYVIEYNIRIGVTSGPMILRILKIRRKSSCEPHGIKS